jgi:hypothetical protein
VGRVPPVSDGVLCDWWDAAARWWEVDAAAVVSLWWLPLVASN